MKSQPNSPICSSTPPIHRRHRRPPATARAAATAAHPRLSPSLTVTRSLQRRLSPWPCGLTNLLKHATDPPPPCAPPPAYLCTCCRPRLRARRHLRLCACRRLQLFPLYLSLSLSLSPSRRSNHGYGVAFRAWGVHPTPIPPNQCLGALGGHRTGSSRGAVDAQGPQRRDDLASPRRRLKT
jgi:hypothetical protein